MRFLIGEKEAATIASASRQVSAARAFLGVLHSNSRTRVSLESSSARSSSETDAFDDEIGRNIRLVEIGRAHV